MDNFFQPVINKNFWLPIEIFFRPHENQKILWSSFRALYGTMQFDITERLLKMAVISDNSLFVSNVDIPPGSHQITLLVTDDRQRKSQKEFILVVEK